MLYHLNFQKSKFDERCLSLDFINTRWKDWRWVFFSTFSSSLNLMGKKKVKGSRKFNKITKLQIRGKGKEKTENTKENKAVIKKKRKKKGLI